MTEATAEYTVTLEAPKQLNHLAPVRPMNLRPADLTSQPHMLQKE